MLAPFGSRPGAAASPYVRPIVTNGIKAVVVGGRLADIDARAFRFITRFARDNELIVRPGRAFERESPPAGADE